MSQPVTPANPNDEPPKPASATADEGDTASAIRELPREVGVMLVSVGMLGFVMPGMAGTPALMAGGMVLWPSVFGKLEDRFRRNCPELHRQGMRQIRRYLDDLNRRFPEQGSA
jgi:hypothetical protein